MPQLFRDMIDQMADQGFNTIRLPYSSEMLNTTAKPNGIDFYQNATDLQGPLGDSGDGQGHRLRRFRRACWSSSTTTAAPPGQAPRERSLVQQHITPKTSKVADWQMLATRYKGNPTVIGFDLHNEPYSGTWGGGGANDWARAAERAGNAVLAVNPDLLIFVEGVGTYQGQNA